MLETLSLEPADALFQLQQDFQNDPRPEKINLGIGVYQTEEGESFVLPSIKKAIERVDLNDTAYTGLAGDVSFLEEVSHLVLGGHKNFNNFCVQATCGGTHACYLAAELAKRAECRLILFPEPTWMNHRRIFGDFNVISFPHLLEDGSVNWPAYEKQVSEVKEPTVLLLHGGLAHKPTGRNFCRKDLPRLVELLRHKPILPFVDAAYLGLGQELEEDLAWVRFLWKECEELMLAVSFSKNATLYGHRTGALFIKSSSSDVVKSQIRSLVRRSISTSPIFGQRVVADVLRHDATLWRSELEAMRQSVDYRRVLLAERISVFASLADTRGLFGMLPLSFEQIARLKKDHGVYIPEGGRINIAGIRTDRIDHLIEAFLSVM